jgi:ribonuclease J
VACFASHIHRIQQIADIAAEQGRRLALLGRSMDSNAKLARKLGLLTIDPALLEDSANIDRYEPGEICALCTGSQGEPLSALARLSRGDGRFLQVGGQDTIILLRTRFLAMSWSVGRVIDDLHRAGAEVIHSGHEPVHASGHARQGELRTLLQLVRPRDFVPIHGEYRHMVHHADLALDMGVASERIWICEDGDVLSLSEAGVRRDGEVPAGYHFIDGTAGDLDEAPLADRRLMAEHGVIVISVGIDGERGEIADSVRLFARGWFEGDREAAVRTATEEAVREALSAALVQGERDPHALNKAVQRAAGRTLGGRFRRQPVIVPAVVVL